MQSTSRLAILVITAMISNLAIADRLVLSPTAESVAPNSYLIESFISTRHHPEDTTWFRYAALGGPEIEIEQHTSFLGSTRRYAFNLNHTLLSDLGQNPSVSVGVRDLFGTSSERMGLYLAASRVIPLSKHQRGLLTEMTEIKHPFRAGVKAQPGIEF